MKINKNLMNEDFLFMRGFFAINLTNIAKRLKLNRSYLSSGGYPEDKYKLVRKEIEKEIAKLYLK